MKKRWLFMAIGICFCLQGGNLYATCATLQANGDIVIPSIRFEPTGGLLGVHLAFSKDPWKPDVLCWRFKGLEKAEGSPCGSIDGSLDMVISCLQVGEGGPKLEVRLGFYAHPEDHSLFCWRATSLDLIYDYLDYTPLAEGTYWIYLVTDVDGSGTWLSKDSVLGDEKIHGVQALQVAHYDSDFQNMTSIEDYELFSADEKWFYYHGEKQVADPPWNEDPLGLMQFDPPIKSERIIKPGDNRTLSSTAVLPDGSRFPFNIRFEVLGLEDVSTTAGEFPDCLKVKMGTPGGDYEISWRALGIGEVKAESLFPDGTVDDRKKLLLYYPGPVEGAGDCADISGDWNGKATIHRCDGETVVVTGECTVVQEGCRARVTCASEGGPARTYEGTVEGAQATEFLGPYTEGAATTEGLVSLVFQGDEAKGVFNWTLDWGEGSCRGWSQLSATRNAMD